THLPRPGNPCARQGPSLPVARNKPGSLGAHNANEASAMSGLLLPNDLKQISSDAEMAKMDEEERAKRKKEQQQAELREAFLEREIHPEARARIHKAVRSAEH